MAARTLTRRLITAFLSLLLIYVSSYVYNSVRGGYWLQPERDGSLRFDSGISFPVAVHWQQALGYRAKYRSDAIGLIYAPLILADRQWFHPTKYVHKTDVWEWLTHEMTISDVHPQWREEWKKSKASE